MHLTKQSAVQSSCDPQTREIILPSRDRRYWFGSVIPGRMAAATCVRACWTIPATEFHFDWGNFPTESCLSTPLPLMVGPKNNPTSKKSFTAGRGKSRKSCEWKPQLAGSQLETSKFGGTHISVWIKFAYASGKKWIHWFQVVVAGYSFLLLGCCGCWLGGRGSVWLLEFKLIVDWQRFPVGLRLYEVKYHDLNMCTWKYQETSCFVGSSKLLGLLYTEY